MMCGTLNAKRLLTRMMLLLAGWSISVGMLPTAFVSAAEKFVYVSCAGDKAIKQYRVNAEGELTHVADFVLDGSPGGLTVGPNKSFLFASIRSKGELASFQIAPGTGKLSPLSTISAGADPAFVATDNTGRFLLSAYYAAGKVSVHHIGGDGKLDADGAQFLTTDKNAHAILTDPTNTLAFVPHTGPNAIFQFRFDAEAGKLIPNDMPKLETGPKTGPRHVAFHPELDVVYCDNEQGSSVTAFHLDRKTGTLKPFQTLSTLPEGYTENNSNARLMIHPSGRFLYASNRGHDSIAGFAIDPKTGSLTSLGQTATEKTPRGFGIDPEGRFLFAAGQGNGNVASYRIDGSTGKLDPIATYEVGKTPWWILVLDLP